LSFNIQQMDELEKFTECQKTFKDIYDGDELLFEPSVQNKMKLLRERLMDLQLQVDVAKIFSANEDVDDVPTDNLPLLLILPLICKLYEDSNGPAKIHNYEQCLLVGIQFIRHILALSIFHKDEEYLFDDVDDLEPYSSSAEKQSDPAEERNRKLARRRLALTLKKAIADLKSKLLTMEEEEKRLLYLDEIKLSAVELVDSLKLLKQEWELLKSEPPNYVNNTVKHCFPLPTMLTIHGDGTVTQKGSSMKVPLFGSGYPSIPTQTVGEWLNRRNEKESHLNDKMEKLKVESDTEESDDKDSDEELAKARERDEFRDWVRRGDGNTYNQVNIFWYAQTHTSERYTCTYISIYI
ncbi:Immunoglobulin-binding protein 1, partial [Trichinella sp. T6]